MSKARIQVCNQTGAGILTYLSYNTGLYWNKTGAQSNQHTHTHTHLTHLVLLRAREVLIYM